MDEKATFSRESFMAQSITMQGVNEADKTFIDLEHHICLPQSPTHEEQLLVILPESQPRTVQN